MPGMGREDRPVQAGRFLQPAGLVSRHGAGKLIRLSGQGSSPRGTWRGRDTDIRRRQSGLVAAPDLRVAILEMPDETRRVEQRTAQALRRQTVPERLELPGMGRQVEGHRFILLVGAGNQLRQADRLSRLAPTRLAKVSPGQVSTGSPAHSASFAVAWAL